MRKGRKHREIPISKKVMLLIKKYTEIYGINGNDYLFMNSRNEQLTRPGITFIINKYAKVCKEENKHFYQKNNATRSQKVESNSSFRKQYKYLLY